MLDATYCTIFHLTGRLTKVEEKETGAVSFRTYVDFCKFAGGQIFCLVVFLIYQMGRLSATAISMKKYYLEPCETTLMELFAKISLRFLAVNYFCKKTPS